MVTNLTRKKLFGISLELIKIIPVKINVPKFALDVTLLYTVYV